MSKDVWYRRKSWSPVDREQFFSRLARSRSIDNKSQYARIQASTLLENGLVEPAVALFHQVLSDWPSKFELTMTHLQLAECYSRLKQPAKAIHHFREALAAEKVMPSFQTSAWLQFPLYVLSENLTDYFEEAEKVITDREETRRRDLPIEVYYWAAAKALFCEHRGDHESARRHAILARDAAQRRTSGFRYHSKIGLVDKPPHVIQSRIEKLCQRPVSWISRIQSWLGRLTSR